MPRIEMTPTARLALFFLRVYLIVLLALIMWKFVRTFNSPGTSPPPPAAEQSVQPGSPDASPK